MIKGTDKVRQFLLANKTPYWNIKRSENSAVIFTSTVLGGDGRRKKVESEIEDDDDSKKPPITIDEGLQFFDQCIKMLEPGFYFIEAKEKREDAKRIMKDAIYLDNYGASDKPGTKTITGIEPGMYSEEQVQQKIDQALKQHEKDKEYQELKKQVEELKADSSDQHIADIIGMVKPYIPYFMQGMYGQPGQAALPSPQPSAAGISGINGQNSETMEQNQAQQNQAQQQLRQRFAAAANKWTKYEPNIVELMEKIAELAEKKDAMYMMVKSTLLKK